MDKQQVIDVFTSHFVDEIEFSLYDTSVAEFADAGLEGWPYEVDTISFTDVDYDMADKHTKDCPEPVREFSQGYFDLMTARFHATEGILVEAVHAYIKTLPEYSDAHRDAQGWMQVKAYLNETHDDIKITFK